VRGRIVSIKLLVQIVEAVSGSAGAKKSDASGQILLRECWNATRPMSSAKKRG
jgi:hypothetical protein